VHKWCWSEENQWPPLKYILQSGFWRPGTANGAYERVKQRLLKPVPKPTLTLNAQFVTVDSLAVDCVDLGKISLDKCVPTCLKLFSYPKLSFTVDVHFRISHPTARAAQ
jgi:hypothetical protein